jgi:general secretion pathway protein G
MKAIEYSEVCPRGGFTLVELLAVIAVIAVVAGLVIGAAGVAGKKADEARAEAEIGLIQQALDEYRGEYGSYPNAGMDKDMAVETNFFNVLTNYVPEIRFRDPWGNGFFYSCDTNNSALSYELLSAGPDGELGNDGSGNDADYARDNVSNRR